MHQTSDKYKEILATDYRVMTVVQFGGTDTPSIRNYASLLWSGVTYGEDTLISVKTSGSVFSDGRPTVGACVSRTINMSLVKPPEEIPRTARLVPYVCIRHDYDFSEWIPKGVFYIDTRKVTKVYEGSEVLEIEGYDAMMRAEQLYIHNGTGPRLDIDVVRDIAAAIGVTVDSRTEAIMTAGHTFGPVDQYSMREVLGFLAAWYGGNFIISDTGELLLIRLNDLAAPPAPIIRWQTGDITAYTYDMVDIHVDAIGINLTYQWYFRTTGTWHESPADGSNTDTLRIQATNGRNGYQYRCVVSSGDKSVTSEAVTLTVIATVITKHPEDVTAEYIPSRPADTVYFTVEATGPGLSYQWQYKSPTSNWMRTQASGYNTNRLEIPATSGRNGYQYRCSVTDDRGVTVTSNPATLTVISPMSLDDYEEAEEWQTV